MIDVIYMLVRLLWHDTEFYAMNDPNPAWTFIEETINNNISNTCPIKKIRIKDKNDPWVTNELLELIHDKTVLQRIAVTTIKPADIERARLAHNQTKTAIKSAKRDFVRDNLERNENDPKRYWDSINQLVCKNKGHNIINLIDNNTNETIDKTDTCTYRNNIFGNIGPNLAQIFNVNTPWTYDDRPNNNVMT